MKIYIDFSKQAITKIDSDVAYVGDVYSNVFELLFFNYGDNADWFPTMSQLAPNSREAGDFSADALEEDESHTYTEDGVTYQKFDFTIGDGWVRMKGRSNFFIWVNKLVDSNASLQRKCYGKLNVALNESTDNYFIQDAYLNPKVKEYIDNTIGDDLETYKSTIDDEVEAQNETIASLMQASPSVFDTASNITALTENKGVAVATDTGYIYYWDSTLTTPAYVSSGLQYNSLANYTLSADSVKMCAVNGSNIENIDGCVNLFAYDLRNSGIATIASDGTITEAGSIYRFYNRTPIHLKVGDYVEVPNDSIHRFYVYYGVSGVWTTVNPWQYGGYQITVEADYIFMFATTDNSDDYWTLVKNSKVYRLDNQFTNLQNTTKTLDDIANQYAQIRYPRNILNNDKLLVGYKRIWNNPTVLSQDANFVIWDYVEVYETGVYNLGRGNGTAQAPNPAIVWDKDKNYVKIFNNGDTLEKGQYISITLGLATYNAWKNTLILSKDSISTYFVAYFNPYYIAKQMLNPNIDSIAHQGINVDATQQYGRNLLTSYVNASKLGFNWGECDVEFSSDNVPVCSHDATFYDSDSQTTITIASHTYEELITYNYFGGTIASLDDVVKTCKINGMGICIDHMYLANTSTKLNAVLDIIKKYRMIDKTKFFLGSRDIVQSIQAWDKTAKIYIPISNTTDEEFISGLVAEYHNDYNEVGVVVGASNFTTSDIATFNAMLPPYAKVLVYTLDDITNVNSYKPYVNGVISNVLTVNEV